jgi:hypothetical protein
MVPLPKRSIPSVKRHSVGPPPFLKYTITGTCSTLPHGIYQYLEVNFINPIGLRVLYIKEGFFADQTL